MTEQMYTTMARVLNGEATPEERGRLEAWLAEQPENQRLFDDLKQAWADSDVLLSKPVFDTEAAWAKVSGHIQLEEHAPTQKGKVIAFSGWQKYMLGAAAVLVIGLVAFWNIFNTAGNTVILASAGNQEISLPDGTMVTLRQGSTLEYPEKFSSNDRKVILKGEAFFDVHRDERRPFSIDAGMATVSVLGTSFNVAGTREEVTVTVATGKVELRSNGADDMAVILTPGQRAVMTSRSVERDTVEGENFLYWKTSKLSFRSSPLEEVAQAIARATGVTVQLDASLGADQRSQAVTISFADQTAQDMLKELCLVTGCRLELQGNAYFIRSGQ